MRGISATSEEEDPGSMPGISAAAEEEGETHGSIPGICNGAMTEEEEESGFKTRDLQPAEVSGEERDMMIDIIIYFFKGRRQKEFLYSQTRSIKRVTLL
jgi:hypothetical protein